MRYFNAAGASLSGEIGEDHDPESHLIPLIIQSVLGLRAAIQVFGTDYPTPDGTCIRDYVHVEDLASAHLLALERLRAEWLEAAPMEGDLYDVLPHIASGRLKPVVDRVLPLEQAGEAHRLLEDRAQFGKIVLSVSP